MPKFCTNCGATLAEGAKFCNKCGAKLAPTEQPQAAPPFTPPPPNYQAAPPYQQSPVYQQPPYQAPAAGTGLQPHIAGMLCYIPWVGWIIAIIFLVVQPYNKDRFVRFHAFQMIFLSIVLFVLSIISLGMWSLLPWGVYSLIAFAIRIGGFVLCLFLMYKAYQREQYKLPVIGDIAMQQAG